jgi:hypothetical protein
MITFAVLWRMVRHAAIIGALVILALASALATLPRSPNEPDILKRAAGLFDWS